MISLSKDKIDFQRLKEIINLLIKYNFDNLVGEMKLKGSRWGDLFSKYNSNIDLDATAPERLRLVFEELGPTFIKLGQMMSTRPDLVGPEMSNEFTKLQDNTIPIEFETIKSILEYELCKPLKEAFQTFEEEQLATASIGQVHQATLHDDTKVAVKIQKPGIQEIVKKDIVIMHHLAGIIDRRISSLKYLNIPGIVDEFEKSMNKEMDYQLEARNTINFQNNFKDDNGIHVPQIYPDYSTSLVLTMEFIEGVKMSKVMDSPGEFDTKLLAERVAKSYFQQIFMDGFFHADPHPGNLYVLPDNVVCYIDFGMMGHIDQDFMQNIGELSIQVIEYKVNAIINQLIYMGILDESVDTYSLKRVIMDILDRYYGATLQNIHLGYIMSELLIPLIVQYQARIPPEFTLITRGVTLIEEVAYTLDPAFDATTIFQPMVKKLLLKKLDPKNLTEFFKDNLYEFEHLMKNLPRNLNGFITKVEQGEIEVKFSPNTTDDIERTSNKVVIAIILAALLLGSSWIIQINRGPMIFNMPLVGFIGFTASGLLGVSLIIYILRYSKI